jgi:hypothetical protein
MKRYIRELLGQVYMTSRIYEWREVQFVKNKVSSWNNILEMIDKTYWVYKKKDDKIYALCSMNEEYVYIKAKKCPYGISMNTYIKIYVSNNLNTILDYAMNDSIYMKYIRNSH